MKRAIRIGSIALVVVTAVLGGLLFYRARCRGGEPTVDESVAFMQFAESVIENLLGGFNEGDYARLSRDFDAQMKLALSEDVFPSVREEVAAKVGRWTSGEVVEVSEKEGYKLVVYKAQFEVEEVEVKVSFRRYGDAELISGLWLDSPKLRE